MTKSIITLALLGSLTLSLADTATIDAQIEAIQTAPAQERVQLMNQFKQQLANMNEQDRSAAMAQMQAKMQTRSGEAQAQGEMTRTRTQEMQMQHSEEMQQAQQMNQNQVANQFMHQNGGTATPAMTTPSSSTPPMMR